MSKEEKHKSLSQKEIESILKEFDKESNTRHFKGKLALFVYGFLVAITLLCVYINIFALWEERLRRALFVAVVVLAIFILYPVKKSHLSRKNYIPWYDILMGVLCSGSFVYFIVNMNRIIQSAGRITSLDIAVGIVGILILLEACRRSVGLPIVIVVACFLAYTFTTGINLKRIIYSLFYTTEGVIGTPIQVCSSYIVMFIIFGSFLERTGISNFFIDSANSIAGGSSGGPAKVSVISSAFCGMVSGSSVANTVTTGSITIPMMKDTGYKPEFAGAVEAAASTGGQIMPPIMGAAAMVMAEMLGMKYGDLIYSAILPAVLYFGGIFIMIHLEAKSLGLSGLPKDKIPSFKESFLKKCYLTLPLIVLVYMIVKGYTMTMASVYATVIAIIVSLFNKNDKITFDKALDALYSSAKSAVTISVACAVAGIIAGVVTLTGLGQVLIEVITTVANNNLFFALFFTMIACIVLGMGLPTTATYIIMASTCAPILTDGMHVPALAAHMFVFYFGIVADITPPVALAAYAGSAIAGADPIKTGINASKLAIGAFIVPYIFVLNPQMLLVGATPLGIVIIAITSFIGITSVSAGLIGHLFTRMNIFLRILSIVMGLALIYPGMYTDMIGLTFFVIICVIQKIKSNKDKKVEVLLDEIEPGVVHKVNTGNNKAIFGGNDIMSEKK